MPHECEDRRAVGMVCVCEAQCVEGGDGGCLEQATRLAETVTECCKRPSLDISKGVTGKTECGTTVSVSILSPGHSHEHENGRQRLRNGGCKPTPRKPRSGGSESPDSTGAAVASCRGSYSLLWLWRALPSHGVLVYSRRTVIHIRKPTLKEQVLSKRRRRTVADSK